MIAKHVPMHSAQKSNFAELVEYLADEQQKAERVGEVRITNCLGLSVADAVREVLNTQAQNTRAASDKTYHVLVSFRVGESLEAAVLHAIEDRICEALGFAEHQRISVVHHDTDNLHFHVAINKIHPARHTIHDPFNAYHALRQVCAALEREFRLEVDNRTPKRTASQNRAADMEHHAGIESLLGWIQRECGLLLTSATSWAEVHATLQQHGLALVERGTGFVIQDAKGLAVKASSVARELSRAQLERRLGPLERPAAQPATLPVAPVGARPNVLPCPPVGLAPPPAQRGRARAVVDALILKMERNGRYVPRPVRTRVDTTELFAAYKASRISNERARRSAMNEIRALRLARINQARAAASARQSRLASLPRRSPTRRALADQIRRALRHVVSAIARQASMLTAEAHVRYPRQTWADWLRSEAERGNPKALFALRARPGAGLAGNTLSGVRGAPTAGGGIDLARRDRVTKKGTIVFRVASTAIRDDGRRLSISRGVSAPGLHMALRLARARFGSHLQVDGTPAFKEAVLHAAVSRGLPITFANQDLEQRRQARAGSPSSTHRKENTDGHQAPFHSRSSGSRSGPGAGPAGYASRGGHASARGAGAILNGGDERGARKPDVGRPGSEPPPESQNRLRGLSTLGVVRLTQRSEVLLPGDVPHRVVEHGAAPAPGLRREIHRVGELDDRAGLAAADKYIAERMEKRAKGLDIPKYLRYDFGEGAVFQFAGLRSVDGQILALLRSERGVEVMAASPEIARQLRRRPVGAEVRLAVSGQLERAGRSQ